MVQLKFIGTKNCAKSDGMAHFKRIWRNMNGTRQSGTNTWFRTLIFYHEYSDAADV